MVLAEWAWLCLDLDPRSLRPVVGVRLTVGILVCGLVRAMRRPKADSRLPGYY